jgi:hypothetical protein
MSDYNYILESLTKRIKVEEAETNHLNSRMQKGDELWEYCYNPGPLCGEGGFAIIRNGEVVSAMRLWVS